MQKNDKKLKAHKITKIKNKIGIQLLVQKSKME